MYFGMHRYELDSTTQFDVKLSLERQSKGQSSQDFPVFSFPLEALRSAVGFMSRPWRRLSWWAF